MFCHTLHNMLTTNVVFVIRYGVKTTLLLSFFKVYSCTKGHQGNIYSIEDDIFQ